MLPARSRTVSEVIRVALSEPTSCTNKFRRFSYGAIYEKYLPSGEIWYPAFSGFLKKFSKGTCALASEAKPSVTSKVVAAKMRFNVFILMYFKVVILSVY